MLKISVPITKPATERIAGRLRQKLSPRLKHATAQRRLAAVLGAWADEHDCGGVGTEWDFRLQMPDGQVDALVPDIAYLSYDRAGTDEIEEIPLTAPDIAIEIRSPNESREIREQKIRRYLAAGTLLVLDVNPKAATVTAYRNGTEPVVLSDVFEDEDVAPGLKIDLRAIFASPARGGRRRKN
jgi:Uma2 family endonuclease